MPDWYLHTALNPFFVGFLGLFFQVVKYKIGPPVITFDRHAVATKSGKYIHLNKFFKKLLTRVC